MKQIGKGYDLTCRANPDIAARLAAHLRLHFSWQANKGLSCTLPRSGKAIFIYTSRALKKL